MKLFDKYDSLSAMNHNRSLKITSRVALIHEMSHKQIRIPGP